MNDKNLKIPLGCSAILFSIIVNKVLYINGNKLLTLEAEQHCKTNDSELKFHVRILWIGIFDWAIK